MMQVLPALGDCQELESSLGWAALLCLLQQPPLGDILYTVLAVTSCGILCGSYWRIVLS